MGDFLKKAAAAGASATLFHKALAITGTVAMLAAGTAVISTLENSATQVLLTTRSVPPGIVSSEVYYNTASSVTVPTPPQAVNGYRFTYWLLNGVRQQAAFGISATALSFTILENTTAEARYRLETADADADGVPDWFEEFHYGSITNEPVSDTDGDGDSLLDEYLNGTQPRIPDSADFAGAEEGGISRRRGDKIAVIVGENYAWYSETSDPPGVVSKGFYATNGTRVTTANLGNEIWGHRFTQWRVNGVRQEGDAGIALTQVNIIISNDTFAVAEYLPVLQDLDADQIPDWYEVFQYGTTDYGPDSDTDEDGRTFLAEYLAGTQPRIADLAEDGAVKEGGISRRRSTLMPLVFSPLYSRYVERSTPPGVMSRDEYLTNGTIITSANATLEIYGHRFAQWLLNGQRQETGEGIAKVQFSFELAEDVEAVAEYYPASQDLDADQVPDWFEYFHYGTITNGPDSDTDNDGVNFLDEYLGGTQPRIHDSAEDGGIIEGGISRRRADNMTVNLQFFRPEQFMDGENFFRNPYNGSTGTFAIAGGFSAPALGDITGNGSLDLVVGGTAGRASFWRNIGSPFDPRYVEVLGAFDGLTNWPAGPVYPALGDWDLDGKADLAVGSDDGVIRLYRSLGSGPPWFEWVGNITAGSGAVYPAFWPDAAGPDLLVLDAINGNVQRFIHAGVGVQPPYAATADVTDVLGALVVNGTGISVADSDEDGLLDVMVSDVDGRIWHFLGQPDGSFFLISKVWGGAFAGFIPHFRAVAVDFDGDGDADIVGGGEDGSLVYLRNPDKHLRIRPQLSSVMAGETIQFTSLDDDGTLAWSISGNRSGSIIDPASGFYTAGTNAGVDQISARNAAGRSGVAWVNVMAASSSNTGCKAVLVDGRRGPNDPVWPASATITERAHDVLRYRGLRPGDITRLGYGREADATPTRERLAAAIRSGEGLDHDTQTLFLFLVDHGRVHPNGDGLFLLSETESISGPELNTWISELQAARPGLSVIALIESCYAARIAGPLGAPGAYSNRRLVMASSGVDELSHMAAGGWFSYAMMWLSGASDGALMKRAHLDAAGALDYVQTAWISAGPSELLNLKLGVDGAIDSGRPSVSVPLTDIYLTNGIESAFIEAVVQGPFAMDKVWGSVVPPGYSAEGDAPVIDLPEIELTLNPATGNWDVEASGFTHGGEPYIVLIQARDVWGQISQPAILRVHKQSLRNRMIIFANGSEDWPGLPSALEQANDAREIALLRGFAPEDIKMFADGDDGSTNSEPANASGLASAITSWADEFGDLGHLSIYMVGEGSPQGMVCANGDRITHKDDSLRGWVNQLLDQNLNATINLVVDGDFSGRFMAVGGGRNNSRIVVVTSTGSDRQNDVRDSQWVGIGRWFWDNIARGRSIRDSFAEAYALAAMAGNVSAMLDDNGDGVYDRLRDGVASSRRFIGSAFVTANDPPFIGKASPSMTLVSPAVARFWVGDVVMPDGQAPHSVWAEVIGPDGVSLGVFDLWQNLEKDRYDGSFSGFTTAGAYLIYVRAGDPENPRTVTKPVIIRVDYAATALGAMSMGYSSTSSTGSLPSVLLPLSGTFMDVETEAGMMWRLDAEVGQRISIEARDVATQRDVTLEVYDAGGQLLERVNDWGAGFGETLLAWEVPATAAYEVRAVFASGQGSAYCRVRAYVVYDSGGLSGASTLNLQTISFILPATVDQSLGSLSLNASASSGLPVRYELTSGDAQLSGSSLSFATSGVISVTAYQDGDEVWESAVPVTQTTTIMPQASGVETYEQWAIRMFGDQVDSLGDMNADADMDGYVNMHEYVAGSDPLNGGSRPPRLMMRSTGLEIEASLTSRSYYIERKTNLLDPEWLPFTNKSGSGDPLWFDVEMQDKIEFFRQRIDYPAAP